MAGPTTTRASRHYNKSVVWTIIGMSWGFFSYSYAGSIIGTTLGQPSFSLYMKLDHRTDVSALIGTATGLFYAGGAVGTILNAYLADRIGRKMTVCTAAVISIIASACTAGSVNIGMFIAFRFFVGLGSHMMYLCVPLWATELVPPNNRGLLAGIVGLYGTLGYIAAAYVGIGFFYYKTVDASQWRAPLAIGAFPGLLVLLFMPWLSESPRWLLADDKNDQAWDVVKKLHFTDNDPDHEFATAEYFQMKRQHELESSLNSSWKEIFRRPSYRKRALIAFLLPFILYSTGNLVVTTYAATIFASLGYGPGQSLQLLAGMYVAAMTGNIISLTYVDRIPRNRILGIGVVACTVITSIETALQARYLKSTNKPGLSAAAAFLFLFLFTFNLFIEGPSLYYTSEIFPTHLRSKGMTINVLGFCVTAILWLEIAPTAFSNIGWRYYLVFICLSVVGASAIFFVFPDTLGKPLEEIAAIFGDDDLVAVFQGDIEIQPKVGDGSASHHEVVVQAEKTAV